MAAGFAYKNRPQTGFLDQLFIVVERQWPVVRVHPLVQVVGTIWAAIALGNQVRMGPVEDVTGANVDGQELRPEAHAANRLQVQQVLAEGTVIVFETHGKAAERRSHMVAITQGRDNARDIELVLAFDVEEAVTLGRSRVGLYAKVWNVDIGDAVISGAPCQFRAKEILEKPIARTTPVPDDERFSHARWP